MLKALVLWLCIVRPRDLSPWFMPLVHDDFFRGMSYTDTKTSQGLVN